MSANLMEHKPKPKFFREKIGFTEFELREEKLDVFDEIVLWDGNPRLQPVLNIGAGASSESELEAELRRTGGYDVLCRNIEQIGQLEPIYVWKRDEHAKYLVLEGATRATILR